MVTLVRIQFGDPLYKRLNYISHVDFYNECAKVLGTVYDCVEFPYRYRTRWNNRKEGSGRFPGFGIIRVFGSQVHIALTFPILISKVFESQEAALSALKELKK